jgi:hypothetical protein
MPKLTIDNIEYELDDLTETAKAQLQMMLTTDQEITRLNAQIAIAQTARMAYAKALNEALPALPEGDTLDLN